MLTCAKYSHEPGNFVWPIPFPYGSASQVGVRMQDASGLEKQLELDSDYTIQDHNVICVLPPGKQLIIYLDAPLAEAIAANAQATLKSVQEQETPVVAQMPEPQSAPEPQANNAELEALAAKVAALEEEKNQALILARAAEADAQLTKLRASGTAAQASVEDAAKSAVAELEAACDNSLKAVAASVENADSAAIELDASVADAKAQAAELEASANANIERLAARVAEIEERLNALLAGLESNINLAESRQATLLSATSQAQATAAGMSQVSDSCGEYAQASAGYAAKAQQSAIEAAASATQARGSLTETQSAAAKSVTANAKALTEIRKQTHQSLDNIAAGKNHAVAEIRKGMINANALMAESAKKAECGAKRSANSAERSADLARCAWKAAWQAALDNARPGIASVTTFAQLKSRVSGCYIINPYLAWPSIFMGVWPVKSLAEALWDGFFFIGEPYPEQPALPDPPPYPDDPAETPGMESAEQASGWLPCGHTHSSNCNCKESQSWPTTT